MRSVRFPQIFSGSNTTNVWKSSEYLKSTKQNAQLLLQTERGELFCDPYFGLMLKHYLFDQNNYILKDALIDIIYTQVALFLPQIKIMNRNDISIITDNKQKAKIFVTIKGVNQIDFQPNTYSLILYSENSNE